MMIVFHIIYDLNFFADISVAISPGFWWGLARATASIFIFLVGLSLTISYSRIKGKLGQADIAKKFVKRGLIIFTWGLFITALTYEFMPHGMIWFGILHLIGITIIISIPLIRFKYLNLILGIIIILTGILIYPVTVSFPWLLPLGLKPLIFYSFDYVPILPWFGIALLGIFAGNTIYPNGKRSFKTRNMPGAARHLCRIGRNSLLVYLIHQPILIGIIYLVTML